MRGGAQLQAREVIGWHSGWDWEPKGSSEGPWAPRAEVTAPSLGGLSHQEVLSERAQAGDCHKRGGIRVAQAGICTRTPMSPLTTRSWSGEAAWGLKKLRTSWGWLQG